MIWENDHLKICFPKHKSNQIGLNKEEAKRIYSNQKKTAVCPLRVLVSYFFVYPQIFIDTKKLFPCRDQKERFHSWLRRVMHYITHIYETLFVDPKEIGSH